ncbi:MAG: preprotein translocase subunit YajC, partial [Victivallaceae bacterium]
MNFDNLIILAEGSGTTAAAATTATTTTPASGEGAAAAQQQSGWITMAPLFIILALFIGFQMFINKKQMKKRAQMIDSMVKGDPVMLNCGIFGTLDEVKNDSF